jgi:hypothetical protein
MILKTPLIKKQEAHYISLFHQLAAPSINSESLASDNWNLCWFSSTYTSHYVIHDEKGTGSVAGKARQDM